MSTLSHFSINSLQPERQWHSPLHLIHAPPLSLLPVEETYRHVRCVPCSNAAPHMSSERQNQIEYLLDRQLYHSEWVLEVRSPQLQEVRKWTVRTVIFSQEELGPHSLLIHPQLHP